MLEKLGQVLKKATNKIANAIFLDKNSRQTIQISQKRITPKL